MADLAGGHKADKQFVAARREKERPTHRSGTWTSPTGGHERQELHQSRLAEAAEETYKVRLTEAAQTIRLAEEAEEINKARHTEATQNIQDKQLVQ